MKSHEQWTKLPSLSMLQADPLATDWNICQRRRFLELTSTAAFAFALAPQLVSATEESSKVRIGLIADLHQDLIPDALERLQEFLSSSASKGLDALIQLGDFATPIPKNRRVIEAFNASHRSRFHVIGNHDTDGGLSVSQVVDGWGMKARFYSKDIRGIKFIVLDCNDRPKNHRGGYPAHIAEDQLEWLGGELQHRGPMVVLSHQPLAGPSSIDNAEAARRLLSTAADRIILAINGHTHIDELLEIDGVHYWHVNSAAYYWVGGMYKHESLAKELHEKYPAMINTCPYQDALFAFMEIDLDSRSVLIAGRTSSWIGKTPAELGFPSAAGLESGTQIVPEIRERALKKST